MDNGDSTETQAALRPEEIASDLVDLARVGVADVRSLPSAARSGRLLEEVRRLRSSAIGGGGNPPGRAE